MDIFTQGQGYQAYNFRGERCQEKKSSRAMIRLQQGSGIDDKVHCPNSTRSLDAFQPPVAIHWCITQALLYSSVETILLFLNMLIIWQSSTMPNTPYIWWYVGRFHLPIQAPSWFVSLFRSLMCSIDWQCSLTSLIRWNAVQRSTSTCPSLHMSIKF